MSQTRRAVQEDSQATESRWSRAFDEMQRAREANDSPNPEVFRDLTKSAGGE
jgi:hypothetical protein